MSSSSDEANNNGSVSTSAISSNAILSLAKDERYVEECRNLVSKLLGWVHPSLEGDITTSWLFAATLYSYFAQRHKGSVGMNVVGLETTNGEGNPSTKFMTTLTLAMASAVSFYMSRRRLQENSVDFMRGNHRLNAFELQRQRMVQRATQQQQAQQQEDSHSQNQESQRKYILLQSLCESVKTIIQSCIQGLSSCAARGPHDMMAVGPFSVGEWLIRLRIAYYCLGGRASFWLPGSKMSFGGKENPLQVDPSAERTLRLSGILILSHAVGELVRKVCRAWIQARVQRKLQQDMSMAETRHRATVDLSPSWKQDRLPCFICQEPRVTPSCSVNCGHVFCWECLQMWIASKKECPVCRTPCRPQDVVQLQNYYPTTKNG